MRGKNEEYEHPVDVHALEWERSRRVSSCWSERSLASRSGAVRFP
jgi:hypothetical protein